jgi:hypothetical protein
VEIINQNPEAVKYHSGTWITQLLGRIKKLFAGILKNS